jgi:lactate permease
MYQQQYDPLGNPLASTAVAALPILLLLYCLALHPRQGPTGRHYGIAAPYAAAYGVVAGFLVSCLVFRMPPLAAASAFAFGSLSGLIGIVWIVLPAMLLYRMTVVSGRFALVRESISGVSADRRLQCVLIAFSFGAIVEGTSGFGTPVAIAGAVMVGLGFTPLQSAVLNLLANTAPVAWGAVGTPIATLASISGLDETALSAMAGRQLPLVSVLVPFWLVATFVRMEGGRWRQVIEVWPALLVAGGSFAIVQGAASGSTALHPLTDILAGAASLACTAAFLRYGWQPKSRFLLRGEGRTPAVAAAPVHGRGATLHAWLPWVLLVGCCALWGLPSFKKALNDLFASVPFATTLLGSPFTGTLSLPVWEMPALHGLVQRMPPVVGAGAAPEAARLTVNWLSTAGTGVFVAALLTGLALGLDAAGWRRAVRETLSRMKVPVLVITQVLGLGYLTRYAGSDAVIGLAFTATGALYPFFAAYLGWLGVFLTGSDTASNALFGNLQRITATQLHLDPVLTVATNSTGGVMGKMIDAQSIMVASAACYEDPVQRRHALGPIFRTVFWHSVAGAAMIGLIALAEAYLLPWTIPAPPAP